MRVCTHFVYCCRGNTNTTQIDKQNKIEIEKKRNVANK